MDRREMLGVLGAGAVGLTAVSAHADDKSKSDDHCCELDPKHAECLKACSECAQACDQTFHHCLMQVSEGKREHARALQLAADCAGFCGLSACMIAKQSPLMIHSCEACAEACKTTAVEVGKFDSREMKAATEKLRACEQSCRSMVAHMRAHSTSGVRAN